MLEWYKGVTSQRSSDNWALPLAAVLRIGLTVTLLETCWNCKSLWTIRIRWDSLSLFRTFSVRSKHHQWAEMLENFAERMVATNLKSRSLCVTMTIFWIIIIMCCKFDALWSSRFMHLPVLHRGRPSSERRHWCFSVPLRWRRGWSSHQDGESFAPSLRWSYNLFSG